MQVLLGADLSLSAAPNTDVKLSPLLFESFCFNPVPALVWDTVLVPGQCHICNSPASSSQTLGKDSGYPRLLLKFLKNK